MKRSSGRLGVGFVFLSVLAGACFAEQENGGVPMAPAAAPEAALPDAREAKDVVFAVRGQLERAFGKANLQIPGASVTRGALTNFDQVLTAGLPSLDILPSIGAAVEMPKSRASLVLPQRADGAFRLRDEKSGLSVEVGLVGATAAAREESNGYVVYRSGYAQGAHIVHRPTAEGTEDYVYFPEKLPETPEVRYELAIGEGVAGLRLVAQTLEMLDAQGAPRLRMAPPYAVDGDGRRIALNVAIEGCAYDSSAALPWDRPTVDPGARHCTVHLTWDASAKAPLVVDPVWSLTTNMKAVRQNATSYDLPTNVSSKLRVIVVGGDAGAPSMATSSIEVFDETTNTWSEGPSMSKPRTEHAMVMVPGVPPSLVVVGGRNGASFHNDSERLTLPAAGQPGGTSWTPMMGTMVTGRARATATVLDLGRIFVAGGVDANGNVLGNAETFADGWSQQLVAILIPRVGHAAFPGLLPTKQVLLMGGYKDNVPTPTGSIIRCDWAPGLLPACTDQFADLTPYKPMAEPRANFAAFRDSGGKIYVAGGDNGKKTAECYNPPANAWGYTNTEMAHGRSFFTVTQYPGTNEFLVAGGLDAAGNPQKTTEYFDATTKSFSPTNADLVIPRARHIAAAISQDRILVAGGAIGGDATAETLHCATDAECASTQYCASSGFCVAKLGQGMACNPAEQCWDGQNCGVCTTGFCVDGFCCDSGCPGQCEACDGPTPGVCLPIAGAPHHERPACVGEGQDPLTTKCGGKCDGVIRDACEFPLGKPCGQGCADATVTSYTCSADGLCDLPGLQVSCSPFQCAADGKTCATSGCKDDMDCGEGFACNSMSGICVPKTGTQQCVASVPDGELDTLESSIGAPDKSCAPYKCDKESNECKFVCETAYDCLTGNVCNPEGKCVKATFDDTVEIATSCSTSSTSNSSRFGWMFALAAAAIAARRYRGRA